MGDVTREKSNLVDYCTEKIYQAYVLQKYSDKFSREGIKLLLQAFPDRYLLYKDTIVIFLRLHDDTFVSLKRGWLDLTNPKELLPLFKEEGANVHVIGVVSNSIRDMMFIGEYLKDKSLSWFSRDMTRLIVHERR